MWAACGINVFVNTSTDQCVLCTAYPIGNELSGEAPVGISHQYRIFVLLTLSIIFMTACSSFKCLFSYLNWNELWTYKICKFRTPRRVRSQFWAAKFKNWWLHQITSIWKKLFWNIPTNKNCGNLKVSTRLIVVHFVSLTNRITSNAL